MKKWVFHAEESLIENQYEQVYRVDIGIYRLGLDGMGCYRTGSGIVMTGRDRVMKEQAMLA
jgi:hypothetical protein